MAPATCLSQVILIVGVPAVRDPGEIGGADVGWLAALGIGQIGLGFALLTVGARLIPAAQVGLITLLEVVLGPLWVWLALDERPSTLTLVGGAIVIVAIVIQTERRAASTRAGAALAEASVTTASTSTGIPNGSSLAPIAERVWRPAFAPHFEDQVAEPVDHGRRRVEAFARS